MHQVARHGILPCAASHYLLHARIWLNAQLRSCAADKRSLMLQCQAYTMPAAEPQDTMPRCESISGFGHVPAPPDD